MRGKKRMKILKIYVLAPWRGKEGDAATPDSVAQNRAWVAEQLGILERSFPSIEWISPHFHPALEEYNNQWFNGQVSTDEVMQQCTNILAGCNAALVLTGLGVSAGMVHEINYAVENLSPFPILTVDDVAINTTLEYLAYVLSGLVDWFRQGE